ncbi:GTP-binding protein [Almyronema epifaneia]|uniref:ATP/GTP-binding protein n=1 Tax=Almyronema epifaneia S1 TaxID=2991925 RepID=A0ABW6ID03_9CYAN
MEVMRLVVTGPVGAGKSTFIRSISEIKTVDTDRRATDETSQLKRNTTVALDFGRLQFNPQMVLHLYGTPGQSRFDFMWDMLIRKAHAYILLVPSHRPADFRQARLILNFMQRRTRAPMIIGLTHEDCEGSWGAENIAVALGFSNPQSLPKILWINANDRQSVAKAVVELLRQFRSNSLSVSR